MDDAPENFELEPPIENDNSLTAQGEARRVSAGHYKRPYKEYVEILVKAGMPAAKDAERKIKRGVKTGRDKSPLDLPPLDEMQQMAEWWRRNFRWSVPDYLLLLENDGQSQGVEVVEGSADKVALAKGGAGAGGATKPDAKVDAVHVDMGGAFAGDEGLKQARALLVATYEAYTKALAAGNAARIGTLFNQWQKLSGVVRQWEKDHLKIQEGRGEVLRAGMIRTELASIFSVMGQSFFNVLLGVLEETMPEMLPVDRRAKALKLRDGCFIHLKKTRFNEVMGGVEQHAA